MRPFSFYFIGRLSFSVESQGFVDKKRGRTLYGRSRAYIKVNGRDYSPHRRGFNVVVVNYKTGEDVYFYSYEEYFKSNCDSYDVHRPRYRLEG